MLWVIFGGTIAVSWLVMVANKRFWDRLHGTPHNHIEGLDYTKGE